MINEDNKKNINKNIFFNLLAPIILNGVNFFTVPIFTRVLGASNYGIFSLYLTWQSILTIFIGLQNNSIIGNASIKYTKKERTKFFSSIMVFSLCTTVIILFLILLFNKYITKITTFPLSICIIMLIHSFGTYGVNFASGLFSYDKKGFLNCFVSVVTTLIGTPLSIILIYLIKNENLLYLGRVIGSAIPSVLIGSFFVYFMIKQGRTFYNKKYWKYSITFSIPIVFHALASLILNQSDRVMLQYYISNEIVGIYSVGFTLANMLFIVWGAFNTTWVPFYYEDMKNKNIKIISKRTNNYLFLYTMLVIGFVFVSPEILIIFAGEEYSSVGGIIPIMALGFYFIFLYSFPINYKYYTGNTKSIAFGTIVTSIVNIVLNFYFIPTYQMLGASIATTISYLFLWMFHTITIKSDSKIKYNYKISIFIRYLIIVIMSILIFYLLWDFWYIRWVFATLVGINILVRIYRQKSIF